MKKKLLYLTFVFSMIFLSIITVEAKEISAKDVEGNSYVIGTHVFTGNTTLTTSHIMLAAKTTESNNIEDMVIYYKTPRGSWINGATGESLTAPESFKVNYTDLKLEEDNDTVTAPKEPIVEISGLRLFDETNTVEVILNILIDDIDDKNNIVDGVGLYLSNSGAVNYEPTLINEELDNKKNLIIERDGKRYHKIQYLFKCNINGQLHLAISSYVMDGNEKKYYSDSSFQFDGWASDIVLPAVEIVESGQSVEIENSKFYKLGIKKPNDPVFSVDNERFKYNVFEQLESSVKYIGSYDLDEEFLVTVPENNVKKYYAVISYYDADGEFQNNIGMYADDNDKKIFTVDTRTLTTPILTKLSEQVQVNDEFYEKQDETTLDSQIEGYEIYRVYDELGTNLAPGYIPIYELVNNFSNLPFANVEPSSGFGYYVARVYATNEEGKRVYSDFSNFVSMVVAPKITASEVVDGKVTITIENIDKYEKNSGIIFKLSSSYYPENKEAELVSKIYESDEDASFEISVNKNMTIHAFATIRDSIYSAEEEEVMAYSVASNGIDIVVE